MKNIEKISKWFVTRVLLGLGAASSKLSRRGKGKLGEKLGDFMRAFSPNRFKTTLSNIEKAFPEKTTDEIKRIARKSYRNLGVVMVETLCLKYMNEKDMREYVRFENPEVAEEIISRGKGVIYLSGHYGNWEYIAIAAGVVNKIPTTVVVKRQKNKPLDAILNGYRTKFGNKIVTMRRAAGTIVRAVRQGEAVAFLADQAASKNADVYAKFFGRYASTYKSIAQLSLKFDVPIVMAFAVRQSDYSYTAKYIELKRDDLIYDDGGVRELTARHVKILEEQIRRRPELWAWQHRRWKHEKFAKENA